MRDDIHFRDQYAATAPGEYRVRLNEFNVWEADRAEYNAYGRLAWEAVAFESLDDIVAISAHRLMAKSLGDDPEKTSGYFLPEQLQQLAANFAVRKLEQGGSRNACAAFGVSKANALTRMPLLHAITNLKRLELIPDADNAMQVQLMLHAAKLGNSANLVSWAIHNRQNDSFDWTLAEALEQLGNATEHLQLSSPSLINTLRQSLVNALARTDANGTLPLPLWHFPEGTPAAKAHEWLDQAANHPLEPLAVTGTVRVTLNMDGNLDVDQLQSDENWSAIDTEHSMAKAAVAAYNWAQDHVPANIESDPLKVEGFRQVAANLAASMHEAPLVAAQKGISQAREQATRFFTCSRQTAYPERSGEAESGVHYQLRLQSEHNLTRAGIATMKDFMEGNSYAKPQSLEALALEAEKELALCVTMKSPMVRLELNCEPKHILRIANPSEAISADTAESLKIDLPLMAKAAGLGHHQFMAAASLTHAETQPNAYRVDLETVKEHPECDDQGIPDFEIYSEQDVYEPSELQALIRNKGISGKPNVAQLSDGTWKVTWSSQAPEENREFFENGIQTYYNLKLLEANGEPVTPKIAEVFAKEAGVIFSNPYAPRASKASTLQLG